MLTAATTIVSGPKRNLFRALAGFLILATCALPVVASADTIDAGVSVSATVETDQASMPETMDASGEQGEDGVEVDSAAVSEDASGDGEPTVTASEDAGPSESNPAVASTSTTVRG